MKKTLFQISDLKSKNVIGYKLFQHLCNALRQSDYCEKRWDVATCLLEKEPYSYSDNLTAVNFAYIALFIGNVSSKQNNVRYLNY